MDFLLILSEILEEFQRLDTISFLLALDMSSCFCAASVALINFDQLSAYVAGEMVGTG